MDLEQSADSNYYEVEERDDISRESLVHTIKIGRIGSNVATSLYENWGGEMLKRYPNGRFRWADAMKVHWRVYKKHYSGERDQRENTRMEIKSVVYRCFTDFADHFTALINLPFSEYIRMERPKVVSIEITRKSKIMPVKRLRKKS